MKILYDYQAFTFQRFGGVSKCFCELIANMPSEVETKIAVKESENVHLWSTHLNLPSLKKPNWNLRKWKVKYPMRGSRKVYNFLMRMRLLETEETKNYSYVIQLLKEGDYDVFHPTSFNPYFLKYIGNKPWVITVHDMMPELFPQYFNQNDQQIAFKKKYLNSASAIIAVSKQTKKDIIRLLNISEEKITVVYHGGPEKEVITEPSLVDAPYFLYVGTRNGYKNFPQTLSDFSVFNKLHPKVKFVCTGGDFTLVEKKMIAKLGLEDMVVHFYADEHDMKVLYSNAIAFIYPSLYEGFGMPILEAFAYGCPVLLNNKSCFPEIAAEAGIYFDSEPGRSNLPAAMEKTYSLSNDEKNKIIETGYRRLDCFSWKRSAKMLAAVYSNVLKEKNKKL